MLPPRTLASGIEICSIGSLQAIKLYLVSCGKIWPPVACKILLRCIKSTPVLTMDPSAALKSYPVYPLIIFSVPTVAFCFALNTLILQLGSAEGGIFAMLIPSFAKGEKFSKRALARLRREEGGSSVDAIMKEVWNGVSFTSIPARLRSVSCL